MFLYSLKTDLVREFYQQIQTYLSRENEVFISKRVLKVDQKFPFTLSTGAWLKQQRLPASMTQELYII